MNNQNDSSKSAVMTSTILGIISSILGYIIIIKSCISIITISITLKKYYFSNIVAWIFIAVGIFLIIKGKMIKDRIKRFKEYIKLIIEQYLTNLNDIANSTGKTVYFVKKDIQYMIDKKFFANAQIDSKTSEIIFCVNIVDRQ